MGLSLDACLKIFEVNSSTYSSYKSREKKRQEQEVDPAVKKAAEEQRRKQLLEENELKINILEIVRMFSGICPGADRMTLYLRKVFHYPYGSKRVKRLMKQMHLIPGELGNGIDPYKNQATHEHPALAAENHVAQNFVQSPFKVILTDITYCFYNQNSEVAYLCVFFDPFMNNTLGYCVSKTMDVNLIKTAYERMMKVYGEDLKNVEGVYVHSDQGSQYVSTTFKELLKRDGFIQSMSRRGNPLDNAPMEACFSRLKNDIRYLMRDCKTFDALERLIGGYIDNENKNRAFLCLAGLSPAEYYSYWKTGIYPLESYFGVSCTELHSLEDFIEYRKKEAEKNRLNNARKKEHYKSASEASARKLMEQYISDPVKRVNIDFQKIRLAHEECENNRKKLEKLEEKLKLLEDQALIAKKFIEKASREVLEELKKPVNWKKYKELEYINHMADNGIY